MRRALYLCGLLPQNYKPKYINILIPLALRAARQGLGLCWRPPERPLSVESWLICSCQSAGQTQSFSVCAYQEKGQEACDKLRLIGGHLCI